MQFAVSPCPLARLALCGAFALSVLPASLAHAAWPADPSTNLAIATLAGEQSGPSVTSDGAGGTIIVWEDFRSGAKSDVYAQRVAGDGTVTWGSNGLAICTSPEFQTRPQVTSDGMGGAIFAWTDYRSGSGDIYVQRLNAAGQVQWTPQGIPICDDGEAQLGVKLCADGAGGAIIVWEDFRADASGDLYAQRVQANGQPTWPINGVPVTTATGGQLSQQIVPSGNGGAIIAWQDLRPGWAGDIYAQKLTSNGSVQWTLDGAAVCTAVGGQYDPQLLVHPTGGAIVTWSDERTGTADIYAQRISGGGTSQWTPNGVMVCGAGSFQTFPVIASDGFSGALIAWEDARSDTTVDIYAQRILMDGVTQWPLNGIAVCVQAGWKSQPAIAADFSGGAIVTWQDQRSLQASEAPSLRGVRTREQWLAARESRSAASQGESVPGDDIYAQRITAEGFRRWPFAGVAVSSASDVQLLPVLVHDGSGGAVISWYDLRSGDWDIYAQHVTNTGLLGITVDVPAATLAPGVQLSTPFPNPARSSATIRFSLPEAMNAEVEIFDTSGRRVRRLHAGQLPAGSHAFPFDLRDTSGRPIGAGLYFVRLRTPLARRATHFVATP